MNQSDLISDCETCQGICCVAPPFAKSTEFAYAKGEGEPCRHLDQNNRCTVHDDLESQGFTGCIKFECFGAGQKVTQQHFHGQNWRDDHLTAKRLFHVFFIVKALHQKIALLSGEDAERNADRIATLITLSSQKEDDLLDSDLDAL